VKDTGPDELDTVDDVVLQFARQVGTLEAGGEDRGEQRPPALATVVPRHLAQQPAHTTQPLMADWKTHWRSC